MSLKAKSWAYQQNIESMGAKFLLVTLAHYADRDGRCWPSQERLAADMSCTSRTIRNCLTMLVDAGVVKIDTRPISGGGRKSSVYILQMVCEKPVDNIIPEPEDFSASEPEDFSSRTGNIFRPNRNIFPVRSITKPTNEPSNKSKKKIPSGGKKFPSGGKKLKPESPPAEDTPPEGVDGIAWREFDEHRRSTAALRKNWTPLARTKAANLLRGHPPEDQRRIVDYSIRGGYTGLFPDQLDKRRQNRAAGNGQEDWREKFIRGDNTNSGRTIEGEVICEQPGPRKLHGPH